jgi:formylglycine-generating enzyme required for sulfatase activity
MQRAAPGEDQVVHRGGSDRPMRRIAAGAFRMGSDRFYPEEAPVHVAHVGGFWIDVHPVTNAQFAEFVAATAYETVAERPLEATAYPGAAPELLVPGGVVFTPTAGPVPLDDVRRWWAYVPGAQWRHPLGPGSDLDGVDDHPVVQVAYEDAEAYASWAGAALPTEAEWERAARGGLDAAAFTWGDHDPQANRPLANTWQGEFPWRNELTDGWLRTSPVGSFPPNGFGLVDMAGNVWEWTCDAYTATHAPRACCSPPPQGDIPLKVLKGGSHLCAPSYCLRYRPAARSPQAIDTGASHIGFRCVVRPTDRATSAATGTRVGHA